MRLRTALAALAIWLAASSVMAQIVIEPEYQDRESIVASVGATIPAGAQVKGPGFRCVGAKLWQPPGSNQVAIWAPPGEYLISYEVMWIQVAPNDKGEQILVGWDWVKEEAPFVVLGKADPGPDPKPDPPVPPPGKRWGIIVEETEQRTPAIASLWGQLRDRFTLSRLLILDKDRPGAAQKYVQAALESNLPLPVLVAVTDAGDVAEVLACPRTVDGVAEVLGVDK